MLQTWLPFPNVYPSTSILTDNQLHKQCIDAKRILDTLENKNRKFRYHPAVKMWKGYSTLLKGYLAGCLKEWSKRGHSLAMEYPFVKYSEVKMPKWWGGPIHASHRAILLHGNPTHYFKTPLVNVVPRHILHRDRAPKAFWPVKLKGYC